MWFELEPPSEVYNWEQLDDLQKQNPDKHEYFQKKKDKIARDFSRKMDIIERDEGKNYVGDI